MVHLISDLVSTLLPVMSSTTTLCCACSCVRLSVKCQTLGNNLERKNDQNDWSFNWFCLFLLSTNFMRIIDEQFVFFLLFLLQQQLSDLSLKLICFVVCVSRLAQYNLDFRGLSPRGRNSSPGMRGATDSDADGTAMMSEGGKTGGGGGGDPSI